MRLPRYVLAVVCLVLMASASDAIDVHHLRESTGEHSASRLKKSALRHAQLSGTQSPFIHKDTRLSRYSALNNGTSDSNGPARENGNGAGHSSAATKSPTIGDELLMILTGAGLVVLQLRRKQSCCTSGQ